MDFTAVPAGTPAATALTMRGGDPDIEVLATSDFAKCQAKAMAARTLPATPASRNFFWSSVAGLIVDYMFTIDPAVLALGVHAEAVTPAALDAAFAYLTQNMTVTEMTEEELRESFEAVVGALDHANMPAALLLVPASFITLEVPLPPLGGAATLYRRR